VQDARSRKAENDGKKVAIKKARNTGGKPVSTGAALDEIVMEDVGRDLEHVAFERT
jgi:hypothetical protein